MMMLPAGVKVHIAAGVTDMRKGMDGLAMLVEAVLREDPFSGHLFAFRGRKGRNNPVYVMSVSRGIERCRVSRTTEGPIVGNQSAA